jgi:DNA topoisomerase I
MMGYYQRFTIGMLIKRVRTGEEASAFEYRDSAGTRITDAKVLSYIEKLKIPPAYEDVSIFYVKSPKILFEGFDSKGRKQQIYSPQWVAKSTKRKFRDLIKFGQLLPQIHKDIQKHLRSSGTASLSMEKCIAVILKVISVCYFRLGHLKYERMYGSHGMSTLKKKHLIFRKAAQQSNAKHPDKHPAEHPDKHLVIEFVGKKAQLNTCTVHDAELIQILEDIAQDKQDEDFLFEYVNAQGERELVSALSVNEFLKSYNPKFTSKMFRTFDTNTMLIDFLVKLGKPRTMTATQRKKNIVAAMKAISEMVNNTPSVCRKNYANERLITMYMENPVAFEKRFFVEKTSRQLFIDFLADS